MPGSRAYTAGRSLLELGGVPAGFVHSVVGGAIGAAVVASADGSEKHLGRVRYEPIALELGLSLDKAVYEWIGASWKSKYDRRDGSVVGTDARLKAVTEREFFQGLVSEVTLPALDASSKDPAFLTIKISPEYTRWKKGSGKEAKADGRQKEWLPSNFRLEIDGLDCTKVTKIDALTVTQTVAEDVVGDAREYEKQATKLAFPDLVVTLPETSAQTWLDWFDDFVVRGNDDSSQERSGTLTYLTADRKSVLGTVSFSGLGIFRLEPNERVDGSDQLATLRASLYCDRLALQVGETASCDDYRPVRQA